MADLNIAEVPYENGAIRYRYTRYLADTGDRWIRHGRFVAYAPDGTVISEGNYQDGLEHGPWKDFHPNGRLAASGNYEYGKEVGAWSYWDDAGTPQS